MTASTSFTPRPTTAGTLVAGIPARPFLGVSRDARAVILQSIVDRPRPLTRFADPARSARARARGTSPAAASSARRARSQSPAQALTRRRNASSVAQRRARSSTAT